MKPQPGLALGGRYRLIRQIAVGGMGEVWVAKDESLARDIAIKVLKEEFVGNSDFLNRFRVEARNAASLSHAHIAQLYDYGEQDGSAYLVMELVHGEPMSDLLEREPILPIGKLLTILAQTARALHAAHVGGVVHRDIKPGNIIIEHSGDVKITDFGVSLAANQVPMTAAGMVMGTAQYLSPEQAIGKPATGVSDIYALGIVAYEAIAGNRPFTGKTPVDIAVAHVNEPVPPLPKNTHAELAALVMRMLAKDPLQRPRSGAALAHTFETLAKEIAANPFRLGARTTSAAPVSEALAPVRGKAVEDHGPRIVKSPTSTQLHPNLTPRQQPAQPSAHAAPAAGAAQQSRGALGGNTPPVNAAPGHGTHPQAHHAASAPHGSSSAAQARPRAYSGNPREASASSQQRQAHQPNQLNRQSLNQPNQPHQRVAGSPASQARTHGEAGSQPYRRESGAAQPPGLIGRIKALGPITLGLIAVVALIVAATVIKSVVSATGVQQDIPTVAGNYSSVQFTSDALTGKEVASKCGSGAINAAAAQSEKDA